MDIRLEGLLEDMQVNWSIIKTALEKESKEIEEAKEHPKAEVSGILKDPSHVENDKVVKHQQRKDVMISGGGIPTELVKKSVEARKRLEGLESF